MTTNTETTLTGAEITHLTAHIVPAKKAATKAKAIERFARVLIDRLGNEAAKKEFEHILASPGYEIAHGRLVCAIEATTPEPDSKAAPATSRAKKAAAPETGTEVGDTTDPHALRDEMAAGRVRHTEKRLRAVAEAGLIPPAPDFTAPSHGRWRKMLAEVVALVEKRDIAGLESYEINAISSSRKAIARYRDAAVIALKAGAK